MFGNFFNSFYYGKAGKSDFNREDLPENRLQLFFEMLRVRWSGIVRVNLLYLLFWIPAILWSALNIATLWQIVESAIAESGEIAVTLAVQEQLNGILFMWLLLLIPCIAVTGPASAGIAYVLRNWARDQHSYVWSDFKDAFKENWKQALGVSAISGFMPFLMYVCYRFYGQMINESGWFFLVPQVLVVILGVVWLLAQQLIYTLMITYKLSFSQLLRNSIVLAVGKLPMSVLMRVITWVPLAILVVFMLFTTIWIYAALVVGLLYLLFVPALSRFIFASHANALCEMYINPRIAGAPVNMGLRQVDEDDYEDDPTIPKYEGNRDAETKN